jgi:DNA-binding NarL/FixJ family response regulator
MFDMEEIQPDTSLKPRILVADDHFLIAETLSMLLAPHFDVVGVVTDAQLVADEVARLRPEAVLLDVNMPRLNRIDVARMILEQAPKTKIVVLTMHSNRVIVKEAFRTGVSAFVVKNCTASDLVLAVRTVLAGGTYVSPEVQERHDSNPSEKLSERQIDVCASSRRGCSAK